MATENPATTMSLDDVDTLSARVTQAKSIVDAMLHVVTEATDGDGNVSILSDAVVRDNLWAASELLQQADAIFKNP